MRKGKVMISKNRVLPVIYKWRNEYVKGRIMAIF